MARPWAHSTFTRDLETRARTLLRTVAFPEADDPRVVEAAVHLARRAAVRPVLVGPRDGVAGLPGEPHALDRVNLVATSSDPLDAALALLSEGAVDGVVAGAVRTSAEVIRAGLNRVGLRAGVRLLSSCFFMEVDDFRGNGSEILTFTDGGVVPDPGAGALAGIAREAVRVRKLVVGDEPRVAFLSYSTLGSARGRSVERVREALDRFRELCPGVPSGGELQADAALVPSVARVKAPDDAVAGNANVLVFPSLDAANIAYKLVQRLAGARALGPVLQGLRAPLNDLSRGATAEDITHMAAITALMAVDAG
ncbi:MAG: phosphate acyltransferase [Gemmatimonadota bacterium]|nr:phosphate acyltransferase [Gemmatimonadota bacterium]